MEFKELKAIYPFQNKTIYNENIQEIMIINGVKDGLENYKEIPKTKSKKKKEEDVLIFDDIPDDEIILSGISAFTMQPLEIKKKDLKHWFLYDAVEKIEDLEFKCKILHIALARLKAIVVDKLRADYKINLI